MASDTHTDLAKTAANARQFLLVGLTMNLLALITAMFAELGLIPGSLFGVGILGGAAGISFMRQHLGFSTFVMGLLWLLACVPVLNLVLLFMFYHQAEALLSGVRAEVARVETLNRTRERGNAPPAPPPAAPQAVSDKPEVIEFVRSKPATDNE